MTSAPSSHLTSWANLGIDIAFLCLFFLVCTMEIISFYRVGPFEDSRRRCISGAWLRAQPVVEGSSRDAYLI